MTGAAIQQQCSGNVSSSSAVTPPMRPPGRCILQEATEKHNRAAGGSSSTGGARAASKHQSSQANSRDQEAPSSSSGGRQQARPASSSCRPHSVRAGDSVMRETLSSGARRAAGTGGGVGVHGSADESRGGGVRPASARGRQGRYERLAPQTTSTGSAMGATAAAGGGGGGQGQEAAINVRQAVRQHRAGRSSSTKREQDGESSKAVRATERGKREHEDVSNEAAALFVSMSGSGTIELEGGMGGSEIGKELDQVGGDVDLEREEERLRLQAEELSKQMHALKLKKKAALFKKEEDRLKQQADVSQAPQSPASWLLDPGPQARPEDQAHVPSSTCARSLCVLGLENVRLMQFIPMRR